MIFSWFDAFILINATCWCFVKRQNGKSVYDLLSYQGLSMCDLSIMFFYSLCDKTCLWPVIKLMSNIRVSGFNGLLVVQIGSMLVTYRFVFTSCVCGRGNVFVVSVSVSVSVCVCSAITFEQVDIETSFLVWWYILTISRSSLSIKVTGSRSRSYHRKC